MSRVDRGGTRVGRWGTPGLAVLVLVGVGALVPIEVGNAGAAPVFPTMNDAGGIYWRSAPNWNDREVNPGSGFYPGTYVSVTCYESGTTVPGSANTMWVQASWASGPGRGSGWMNEHFVNDGAPIDRAAPGVPSCASLVSCYGDYCSGTDPSSSGCSLSAVTVAVAYIPGTNSPIDLRWSPICKTKWTRVPASWGRSYPNNPDAVQRSTGYKEVGVVSSNSVWSWTRQIYSPSRCVYAAWSGPPGNAWTGCW